MFAGGVWQRGVVWSDEDVDGERLLLLNEPAGLQGCPVVIRSVGGRRSRIARVERSSRGSQGLIHPELARQLGTTDARFDAEWRRARWCDVVWDRRMAVLVIVLVASAAAITAVLGFHKTRQQIGWGAVAVLAVALSAALLKARQHFNALKP